MIRCQKKNGEKEKKPEANHWNVSFPQFEVGQSEGEIRSLFSRPKRNKADSEKKNNNNSKVAQSGGLWQPNDFAGKGMSWRGWRWRQVHQQKVKYMHRIFSVYVKRQRFSLNFQLQITSPAVAFNRQYPFLYFWSVLSFGTFKCSH